MLAAMAVFVLVAVKLARRTIQAEASEILRGVRGGPNGEGPASDGRGSGRP